MEGHGTYMFQDQKMYNGLWKNNMMNDQKGEISWPDGKKFVGIFKNNKMFGKGKIIENKWIKKKSLKIKK